MFMKYFKIYIYRFNLDLNIYLVIGVIEQGEKNFFVIIKDNV